MTDDERFEEEVRRCLIKLREMKGYEELENILKPEIKKEEKEDE